MSASSQVDALITMLSAASVFGASMVGKEVYSVLGECSGSCAVVSTIGLQSEPDEFGRPPGRTRVWVHQIDCFSKDTGDPLATKARNLLIIDTVTRCLESDSTLQNTSSEVSQITCVFNPNYALDVGGIYFSNPRFTIACEEFTEPDTGEEYI